MAVLHFSLAALLLPLLLVPGRQTSKLAWPLLSPSPPLTRHLKSLPQLLLPLWTNLSLVLETERGESLATLNLVLSHQLNSPKSFSLHVNLPHFTSIYPILLHFTSIYIKERGWLLTPIRQFTFILMMINISSCILMILIMSAHDDCHIF